MAIPESTLLILLGILILGLIVPELFRRLKLPYITSLILLGAILGPYGLDLIKSNEVIEFFGFLGMTFLMLMAGLETSLEKLKQLKGKLIVMASINTILPFLLGIYLMRVFGYDWPNTFLIGIIFISSSIAIIIPSLKSAGLFKKDVGQLILSAVVVADIISLILLALVLQNASPISPLPLLFYFALALLSVIALFIFLPKILSKILSEKWYKRDRNDAIQLRLTVILIFSILAYFSFLGVHPILIAFIIGLALSHMREQEEIHHTLSTLGYGLFIPIFFFIVGMQMNLTIFHSTGTGNLIIITIVSGLLLSKFVSGFLAGRIVNLSNREASTFGVASTIHLTTSLAVIYAAQSIHLLDSTLVTSILIVTVITTFFGPILLKTVHK